VKCERLDTSSKNPESWTEIQYIVPELTHDAWGCAAVTVDKNIYVVGGVTYAYEQNLDTMTMVITLFI